MNKNLLTKWDNWTFATICDRNYIAQAIALCESAKKNHKSLRFNLCLVEEQAFIEENPWLNDLPFDVVVTARSISPNYDLMKSKYDVYNLCCAVKPSFLKYCLEGSKSVAFVDPDCYFYSELIEIADQDMTCSLIFTPHLTKPGDLEMEVSSMRHGIFNLGFLAVNLTPESEIFLDWWEERLKDHCEDNAATGVFADQSWASLAVGFAGSLILRNPGINYATWTLNSYRIDKFGDRLSVDDRTLVFIHYSGWKSGGLGRLVKLWDVGSTNPIFLNLLKEYEDYVLKIEKNLSISSCSDSQPDRGATVPKKIGLSKKIKRKIRRDISRVLRKILGSIEEQSEIISLP